MRMPFVLPWKVESMTSRFVTVVAPESSTPMDVASLGRVERLNGAWRIYPHDKSKAPELAQAVVDLVAREGWKVDGMYSERGELDEVFRRITLPDTVKQ